MARQALTTLDDFNYWVADMDDALERFKATLPADVGRRLDYTPESLDALEHWIMDNYATSQEIMAPEQTANLDGATRYFGETLRKALGGFWDIDLDNEKNAYFGIPVVKGPGERPTPVCPMLMVGSVPYHRKGTFLRTLLENNLQPSSFPLKPPSQS